MSVKEKILWSLAFMLIGVPLVGFLYGITDAFLGTDPGSNYRDASYVMWGAVVGMWTWA